MRVWVLLLCVTDWHLDQHGADGKRFDPSMVDPLMRRSSLDKNFMRFGRSSPSYTEEDEAEDSHDTTVGAETSKEDNFLRSMRGKDNFIRFGRARNDNFMRFGRGKQDNFMRFGKARNDNFMRFGRGNQDNYMRFGRGKQDSYMRFGRGKQDSYMRFGRGKQDNFMRFGRGKQDNFMRFGRDPSIFPNDLHNLIDSAVDAEASRDRRGKQDNFMRFGRSLSGDPDDNIPIAMRSGNPKGNSNFIRFGRARPDNFMRFGKSDVTQNTFHIGEEFEEPKEKSENDASLMVSPGEGFTKEVKSKDLNLIRFERQPSKNNAGFIRFGRNSGDELEENTQQDSELIPPRLKRSISYNTPEDIYSSKLQGKNDNHAIIAFTSLSDDFDEEYSAPIHEEEYNSRRKRSLTYKPSTPSPFTEEDASVDFVSTKLHFDSPAESQYQASLFSAGLPNVIVGPEFSLLPDLDPPSTMLKRGRPGDQNFLRLG